MHVLPSQFSDYKAFLRKRLSTTKPSRGIVSLWAAAAGCQRSYFSQVLNMDAHLTPDHAFGLSEHLRLSEREARYFRLLVDHARAGSVRLKQRLERELKEARAALANLEVRFGKERVPPGQRELLYYSSWLYAALHVIVSIPEYRSATAIAARLELPVARVERGLEELAREGFIQRGGKGWTLRTGDLHLPKRSPLNAINHANWRARAIERVHSDEDLHYTSVASMSRADFDKIRDLLLAAIERGRQIIKDSADEELVCTTLDFFRV